MSDKSYVSMEQHQCFVCGCTYDTGAILLDKRLKASMEPHTVTGTGLCPEHQKLKDDGFIALIEASGTDSAPLRTGRIAHVKPEAFVKLFNTPIPPKGIAFCEKEVMDMLEAQAPQAK